ncbi:uncharacterized protein LOC143603808 [Bidens hawaiensis]|uniref:uncharacterized protein LOC143603808 n=1 Tax=Bidens hawaiensis TaxID=980011 RepID=UPI00404AF2D1
MDDQDVSNNKIPRLLGQGNYIKWKVLLEVVVCYNDVDMWNSIKIGPYVSAEGASYNQILERQMRNKDDKALYMLKQGLSWEILTSVNHHTTSKAIFEVVVEIFEELKDIKKDKLKQQLDRFMFKEGERLKYMLQRFVAIVNEIRTTDLEITNFDLNKKLLSSLYGEWYTFSKYIKQKANFPKFKLYDVICFLQAAEMK